MKSQSLFIVGAPRSGTTFFTAVLNRHPLVQITNESRIFVLMQDMIELRARHSWLLETPYQERFAAYARRHAGAWVEGFYREALGITAPIWGDKHPHYADPEVLAGQARQFPKLRIGSSLRLIRDSLPAAKFIHLHRDPRHVAWSLMHKGWVATLGDGAKVWRRHVEEIDAFFGALQPEQRLTVPYWALLVASVEAVAMMVGFLGITDGGTMLRYLAEQRRHPTPMSGPVSNIAELALPPMTDKEASRALERSGPSAARLGYATIS
jgi:hypothetical protein